MPTVKPICLKLIHFPILFKIAQHKHICPEYSYSYYPQLYGNSVPLRFQQQLSIGDATVKPIKYRQSFPHPVVFRPTKAQTDYTQIFTRRQNYEQAFNFKTTTAVPQVFNFRPSNQKYQRLTTKPDRPINYSFKYTHIFTGISLNYRAVTPETPNDVELANILQQFSEVDYPAEPIADPIVKLDFS